MALVYSRGVVRGSHRRPQRGRLAGATAPACPMRPLAAADKMQAGPLTPALTGRLFLPVRSAASIAQPLAATDDNCRKAELNHHVGGVLRGCYIYEKAGKDPFGWFFPAELFVVASTVLTRQHESTTSSLVS